MTCIASLLHLVFVCCFAPSSRACRKCSKLQTLNPSTFLGTGLRSKVSGPAEHLAFECMTLIVRIRFGGMLRRIILRTTIAKYSGAILLG